ncbi:hypothetical protein [Methanobacterium sp. ACI-7]|uniref:hypothetical protein n=1 Tax=unclassified Methanobacterium TaxID=2627676 RepID=UPI0039C32B0A
MGKLKVQEYQKLISILTDNEQYLSTSVEEKAADILESIVIEAKSKNSSASKAKINLITTPQGPEIGVSFEE